MAEYIKRDAALRALRQVSAPTPDESYIVEKCTEKINRLPMMEVVRCKDCERRGEPALCPMCFEKYVEYEDDGYSEYDYWVHDYTTDDGFCDRGERSNAE